MCQSVCGILDEKSKNHQCIMPPAKLVVVELRHIYMYASQILHSGFVNSSDMYEEKVLQREASG